MKLAYKTSINCQNCVRAVSGFIESVEEVSDWTVDTNHPDKILSVELHGDSDAALIEAVEDAGFEIKRLADK